MLTGKVWLSYWNKCSKNVEQEQKATVLAIMQDPSYGVAEFAKDGNLYQHWRKPKVAKSNYAVVGFVFYL
jgi:dTDP-glucose pyrophosphorylase